MKRIKLIRMAVWALLWSGLGYGGPLLAASSSTIPDTVKFTPARFLAFDCSGNRVTSLDVSGSEALTTLSCQNNALTSLDVRGSEALTTLSCQNNALTSLDVRGCASLTDLNCQNNALTSLDVSGSEALTTLSCRNNALTSLDVSGCGALRTLHAERNLMPLAAVYTLLRQRPVGAAFHLSPQLDTNVNLQPGEAWNFSSRLGDIAGAPTKTGVLTNYSGQAMPDSVYDVNAGRLRVHKTGGYWLSQTHDSVRDYAAGTAGSLVKYRVYVYVCDTISVTGSVVEMLGVYGGYTGAKLDDLRISQGSGLVALNAGNNRLSLSVLADLLARRQESAMFRFNPQSDSVRLALEEVLDLGSEWRIGGLWTRWTLYPEVSGTDNRYTCSREGEFRFHEPGDYRLELKNTNVCDYGENGLKRDPVTFTYYITVAGTRPGTANEGVLDQDMGTVYTRGRTICLSEDMGEVCVYTQAGQKVYAGRALEIPVARAGFYVVQAGNRRFKVVVR